MLLPRFLSFNGKKFPILVNYWGHAQSAYTFLRLFSITAMCENPIWFKRTNERKNPPAL